MARNGDELQVNLKIFTYSLMFIHFKSKKTKKKTKQNTIHEKMKVK